ncbi:hypothetical protein [Sporomusa malonica]|uniref:Uncharacterized protein n=1 Tax=Sporomusa malonica TaxID=112901 RepID=A0A1W2D814_9FIRM|nr:hypothetical protein [Sporomusa malonica]SMC93640.1 hypothetical protein SAMN04488500_11433 [Sporomusa malonica]
MFERVATGDAGIIARGLLILLTIIVIGVGVAEHQLAALTQRPEQERFFYIGRNQEHVYSAYAFGYGFTLGSVYSLGNISLTERSIVLKFSHHTVIIPTKVEIDGSRLWYWFSVWHRQFVEEAFATKKKAIEYWNQAKPYIETASQYIRARTQYAIQQLSEYIREYR